MLESLVIGLKVIRVRSFLVGFLGIEGLVWVGIGTKWGFLL